MWEPLEDNPRFVVLVDRIGIKLDEQRELVHEMDEPGEFTE